MDTIQMLQNNKDGGVLPKYKIFSPMLIDKPNWIYICVQWCKNFL